MQQKVVAGQIEEIVIDKEFISTYLKELASIKDKKIFRKLDSFFMQTKFQLLLGDIKQFVLDNFALHTDNLDIFNQYLKDEGLDQILLKLYKELFSHIEITDFEEEMGFFVGFYYYIFKWQHPEIIQLFQQKMQISEKQIKKNLRFDQYGSFLDWYFYFNLRNNCKTEKLFNEVKSDAEEKIQFSSKQFPNLLNNYFPEKLIVYKHREEVLFVNSSFNDLHLREFIDILRCQKFDYKNDLSKLKQVLQSNNFI